MKSERSVTKRHPGGRPTSYRPEYADMARRCCLAFGATTDELAKFFGVSHATIDNWKQAHPEFLVALNETKFQADAEVIQKLFHRAIGYSHEAVKIFMTDDGPVKVDYTEHYPPDTTAMIFWLKNRQPELWRDVQRREISGIGGAPIEVREVRERNVTIIESLARRDAGEASEDEVGPGS